MQKWHSFKMVMMSSEWYSSDDKTNDLQATEQMGLLYTTVHFTIHV